MDGCQFAVSARVCGGHRHSARRSRSLVAIAPSDSLSQRSSMSAVPCNSFQLAPRWKALSILKRYFVTLMLLLIVGAIFLDVDRIRQVLRTNSGKNGSSPRVFCWIVTQPANRFKAQVVRDTWAPKCDKFLFVSSKNDSALPAIGFPIGRESRQQLWNKANHTLRYVYDHYLDDFDWFFKADDDTYVVMENLRRYIASKDPSLPWFLGRRFKLPVYEVNSYMTGGPGYLMTRETLRRVVEFGLKQNSCASKLNGESDDLILGRCLEQLGALSEDSKDDHGLPRFYHFNIQNLMAKSEFAVNSLKQHEYYPTAEDKLCCSSEPISFHKVSGHEMQVYHYLLYDVKIRGQVFGQL